MSKKKKDTQSSKKKQVIRYFIPPATRLLWSEFYPIVDIDEIAVKIITSKS